MSPHPLPRRYGVLAASHGSLGLLLALLVFVGLPARDWRVDVPAGLLIALSFAAASTLWLRRAIALRLSRIASGLCLATGLLVVTMLAGSVSYLAALYGPVGAGGALLMAALAALLVPYLIGLPLLQWRWARRA